MLQHAKKMILVDPERSQQNRRNLSDMDKEIEKTLNDQMPDDIKAKHYFSILTKYVKNPTTAWSVAAPDPVEDELLQSVPLEVRYKAKRILRLLRNNSEVGWNGQGQLIYRQQVIPDSNIIDLVNDILKYRGSASAPEGWEEFASALRSSGITKELVPNEKRWKYITQQQQQPTRLVQQPTLQSKAVSSSTRKKRKKINWENLA